MVKVSIIVPVYNVEKYLQTCLESLVNQTLKDIEIIIVNDGSPDNSQNIIDSYCKKYPKIIKSYKIENSGQGEARNFGISKANGKYIMYVDSDDYISNDMAEILYNEAVKTRSDVVFCGNYVVDEDYKIIKEEPAYSFLNREDVFLNAFFGKMAVWNKIYKKNLIIDNNIKFRSKKWYEDLDFTCKIIMNAKKMSVVDKPLYYYVLRKGSTMNNDNVKRNLEILDAFDNIMKYKKDYHNETEFLAIQHIYIASVVRVINAKAKCKKEVIKTLKGYVETNFPSFKNNKYLYSLDRNKKIIYNLVMAKQYWLIKLLFKLKSKIA
jgi:glycosyltransferase involved in cell wall biosynthesis